MSFLTASWQDAYFFFLSDQMQVHLTKNGPRWIYAINKEVNPIEHMIVDLIWQAPCVKLF